ncbi:type II toxin-antitoxin system RelE family toxin [Campylobacter concisus]|uniref:type II toxin-antitoxin system RelE family toxin n=1 Tax=Campylobacter concisus TaxID=199 RepID=UPI000CD93CB4|nr:type II toxin-antitoxin system RelE/ParE family toxin [Campylobacter concisus]
MSYELEFLPSALKEWQKLDNSIKVQFKKKLSERLENPKVTKDKLRGYEDVYKIKLRDVGYRLAYQVKDSEIVVLVLVVGKRENNEVYEMLKDKFNQA